MNHIKATINTEQVSTGSKHIWTGVEVLVHISVLEDGLLGWIVVG